MVEGARNTSHHWLVKRAVRTILAQRLDGAAYSDPALVWSNTRLAPLLGAKRKYLGRKAREANLDLPSVFPLWRTALVLKGRFIDGWEWGRIALHVGYRNLSGVSELLHRVVDRRLRTAKPHGLEWVLDQLATTLEGGVAADPKKRTANS